MLPGYKTKRQPQPLINPLLNRNCKQPHSSTSTHPGAFSTIRLSQTLFPNLFDSPPLLQETISQPSEPSSLVTNASPLPLHRPLSNSKRKLYSFLKAGKVPFNVKDVSVLFKSQENILNASSENSKTLNRALEPKVLQPFVPTHGETPRRIEIERKRVLYASQDISLILQSMNIHPEDLSNSPIPLHYFDNTDYDSRDVYEWLNMDVPTIHLYKKKLKENSESLNSSEDFIDASIPVPANAFIDNEWVPCHVIGYRRSSGEWKIKCLPSSSKSGESFFVPRIFLHFLSEDAEVFAHRIQAAIQLCRQTLSELKIHLFVTCMPSLQNCKPTEEDLNKILLKAVGRQARLSALSSGAFSKTLLLDVTEKYQYVQKLLSFHSKIKTSPMEEYAFLNLHPSPIPSANFRDFVLPGHRDIFLAQRKQFAFHSFLTKMKVVETWRSVRLECARLLEQNLFLVPIGKITRIEEFDVLQSQHIANTKTHILEVWIPTIQKLIRNGLKDVSKGWYNIHINNPEVHAMSKLKSFMTAVKFLMEDTLRFLAMKSLEDYVNMIGQENPKKPILYLGLTFKENMVTYDVSLDSIKTVIMDLVDKSFTAFETIPDVEPLVLQKLFWANKPLLSGMGKKEPFVIAIKQKLASILSNLEQSLNSHLLTFEPHLRLLLIDVSKFISNYEKLNKSVSEMEQDMALHQKEWESLDASLTPAQISICQIHCEILRKDLKKDLSKSILELFAKKTAKAALNISSAFQQISLRCKEKPLKAEELGDLREYLKTVPEKVEELRLNIEALSNDYLVLDRYRYEMANDEFKTKWTIFGWPSQIEKALKLAEENLLVDEQTFIRNLQVDQEVFKEKLHHLGTLVSDFSRHSDLSKITEIITEVQKLSFELKEATNLSQLYNSRERLFGLTVTNYEEVNNLCKDFEPFKTLWTSAHDWLKWKVTWNDGSFLELNPDDVEKNLVGALRAILKTIKVLKNSPGCLKVATQLKTEMEAFKPSLPLIQALRNPGMRDRHWEKLSNEFNMDVTPKSSTTLSEMLQLPLLQRMDLISKISEEAGKEYSIEAALDKMETEWRSVDLEIVPYRETGTYIIKLSEEIGRLLDDHIVMTQSMNFSPFKKPFAERITLWDGKLRLMQEVLEEWSMCQRQWMYLEPIFQSEDIVRQLPTESKRFASVDKMWRKVMQTAFSKPAALEICSDSKLLDGFRDSNKLLEMVGKGLSAYLESKRIAFPRFFFLSDDELLQILSQTKDPTAVQPHLRKAFENMTKLQFESDSKISAMYSADGECVPLDKPFYPQGNVEEWLLKLEATMKTSLRYILKLAIEDYPKKKREAWVLDWPGQLVIASSQTYFTRDVTLAIQAGTLKTMFQQQLRALEGLVELVRGKLSEIARLSIGALIVIDVHARDVLTQLIDSGIESANDFEWISQLRYYWEDEDLHVRIVNAHFRYGFEYLGNNGRLVITPLTDRCYLTLTGAMHLGMGGAPAGPAGTGKTETTKDLAKALAKQCVVFNCSDQLDYLAMAKFFKGLASSGAWACFDEFNRIDIEVLSVIAQQISTIQKAVAAGMTKFTFEGMELSLDPTNAIFITMNPGYAGRTELPDNLKALFRPVAMMIPDYAMIGEISLFSFGFSDAKKLSQKMVATFKLSSEQLSSQDHYDFGMRAVKTVISAAGNLKMKFPEDREDLLLLRALCDVNVPKFLAEDIPLFNGIISDLFPGLSQPKADHATLVQSLKKVCEKHSLLPEEVFLQKCLQMYDTINVRHGMMLVGPTGGGKTCCYRVLQEALPDAEVCQVRLNSLNPKSITMGQLYGEFDEQTHEWSDGILSCMVREGAADTSTDRKWYIFDGPVDAVWIESMNTVLDDNKKLCLTSGEIIKLIPTQTLIFEVDNLAHASPATVSRCGMVYMEPGALGLIPLVKSWTTKKKYPASSAKQLLTLFEQVGFAAVEFVRKNIKETVATSDGNLIQSSLRIFSALVQNHATESDAFAGLAFLEPFFYFSLIWSAGATSDGNSRQKFSQWLQEQCPSLPRERILHDYQYNPETKEWLLWIDDKNPPIKNGMMVATMDTVRHNFLLDILLHSESPVLCTGPTGTGKSVAITEKIMKGMKPHFNPVIINFSARTSANQTQDLLDSKVEKRRKGVYGPPMGKKLVIFIDDLNMPQMESTGAQPPIELLRQWMDYGGWYDLKQVGKFMEIVDIVFVAAMGPPGGGRNPITQRLTRHFSLLSFIEMDNYSLSTIFNTILSSFTSQKSNWSQDICYKIVSSSIFIYNTLRQELLPTPSKSHYTYNLRDLANIFQGMLMADFKSIETEKDLILLWIHESQRVFSDRLVDATDKGWFNNLLRKTMNTQLNTEWDEIVAVEPVLFGDYTIPGADPKLYIQVKDLKKMVTLTEEYLEEYNAQVNKPMKLVMFLDAIEHVSRICRILRQPKGHGLLLGVGGSGRQSLARLACHMEEYEFTQVEISKNYGFTEWKEDLKKVLFKAGLEAKPIVFIFCDTQVFNESCVEDINNLLNSGDVPNLYNSEDLDKIYNAVRSMTQDSGLVPTKENMFSTYLNRVRDNLHIVFCMSPIGDAFRNRLRMFPSLVNCCTIDWFSMWPEEALRSVAANAIAEVSDLGSELVLEGIVNLCVVMHESVRDKSIEFRQQLGRHNYITPTSYLELLGLYKKLLEIKRSEIQALRKRTATGLDKLLNATKEVQVLQEDLEAMQPMLIQTSEETEYAMKKIAADKIKAEEIREVVQREEAEASKKAAETKSIADDAQRDLDEALPALAAALESLNSLSKNDVVEIRTMQRPPEGVKLVMEAVCIMKGLKPKKIDGDKPGKKVDDYWEVGKALLSDPGKFLDSLMTYDKDNIPENVIQKIKPYIDNPDFAVEVISKVSKAATSICAWVRAMEKYYWVSRSIEPKRARLKEAQDSLEVTLKTLAELQQKLKEAEVNINEMEKKYLESVAKKEELGRKVAECNVKLSRAGKLISGLGSEKLRWSASVEKFDQQLKNIVGDVLLASGTIAYLGPFTTEYRQNLLKEWSLCLKQLGIPHSSTTSLMDVLGDPSLVRSWELAGLPTDSLSRENGLISFNSRRWSLFIDPQGQANKWIRNLEKDRGLDIIKLSDKDYLRTLENSIRFGKPCLLENVEEHLDAALEPVLLRQTFKQNSGTVIKLGDNILPYHNDFKLYITTKLPNPHYSPEISAIVTLLNFTLAASGLEDQLLAIVVTNERPDLEEAKNQLMLSNAQMKKELQEIEDKILYLLSSVQGSPVDDERLIDTLAASKQTSSEIAAKVSQAELTEKDIDITRNGYVPVAILTRILFFCITEMSRVDPMYQYSLRWFMNLFSSALKASVKSQDLIQRLTNINDFFTFSLYSNVCRSLFERHKLLFSFLLCIRILLNENAIDLEEFKFLITGTDPPSYDIEAFKSLANPAPDWLTGKVWGEVQSLSKLNNFLGFNESVEQSLSQFKTLVDSMTPHKETLPDPWQSKLDAFQRLLIHRCFSPDRMIAAIQDFVGKTLGDRFVEPQTSELAAVYKESTPWTPIIFVLSPGADPASNLYKFAEEMKFTKKFLSVSLGQGQGPRAETLLRDGMEKGLWILLQNCHLAPSWMPTLDRFVDSITPDKVHRDFRVWMTSTPTPKFPVSILQNGVKMTIEPPNGIKANLLRTYATFNDEFLESCAKANEWKKLLFSLSFFHAIVQERRKFGPLGWNVPYDFTDGDHRICMRQLKMFLEEYNEIPFKVLKYTVGHINYGGRVTDDWDRRLIMNILADFYCPAALEDKYRFAPSCEIYTSIPVTNLNGYRSYIKTFPLNEPTEIFAMHNNANITFAQKETFTLFETLTNLMPRSGTGKGQVSREEQLISVCESIVQRVTKPLPLHAIMAKYPVEYKESMSTVLVQEVVRYNRILHLVHSSLQDLLKALKGIVVMSEKLDTMANSMYINQVPALWSARAYPSLKPLASWVSDLVARMDFLKNWIENGVPSVFWISGFFFPQAFLTGTLQNFARKYAIPIDTIQFSFNVIKTPWEQIQRGPEDGCYIRGLLLEGARWDPIIEALNESRPKELYSDMAVIWLLPVQNRAKPSSGIYDCPVYKTLSRAGTLSTTGHSTNYVLTIELNSTQHPSHWIKRGVALVCSGNW